MGLSQQALAARSGVSQPMICRAENGEAVTDRTKIESLDRALKDNGELLEAFDSSQTQRLAVWMGVPNTVLAAPLILISWDSFPQFTLRSTHFTNRNPDAGCIAQAPHIIPFDPVEHRPLENSTLIQRLREGRLDCAWVTRTAIHSYPNSMAKLATLKASAVGCDWVLLQKGPIPDAIRSYDDLWKQKRQIAFLSGSPGEEEYQRIKNAISQCPTPLTDYSTKKEYASAMEKNPYQALREAVVEAVHRGESVLCLTSDPLTSYLEAAVSSFGSALEIAPQPEFYANEALPGLGTVHFDLLAPYASRSLNERRMAAIIQNVQHQLEGIGSQHMLEVTANCFKISVERVRRRLAPMRDRYEVSASPYLLSRLVP